MVRRSYNRTLSSCWAFVVGVQVNHRPGVGVHVLVMYGLPRPANTVHLEFLGGLRLGGTQSAALFGSGVYVRACVCMCRPYDK